MATIAAGRERGISPNADLCLVKIKNTIRHKFDPQLSHTLPITVQAAVWFLNEVREHIDRRMRQDSAAKSVINMSWGKPSSIDRYLYRMETDEY